MTELEKIVRAALADDGPMPLADYMALCLSHPEHGYYMARQPFGRTGDFITAPEASQIFGELIGVWAAAGWRAMSAPSPFHLVELGPGRGLLMKDLLRAARVMPGFTEAGHVHLVETSPALRKVQQETLAGTAVAISWHEDIEGVPEGPAIIIANEFFDALPVHHYELTHQGWRERMVVLDNGALSLAAIGDAPDELPGWARQFPAGTIIELSPEREDYARRLATRLAHHGGALLAIDYGHARPGPGETLQAVARHRKVSIFHEPGKSDITAHVDFSSLAGALAEAGLTTWGPVDQRDFLLAMGLEPRLEALRRRASARQRIILRRGAERIAGEEQMGRLFKVLAATSPGLSAPPPFKTASEKSREQEA